jgi:phospholipid-binding lipoprotein MlaA
VKGTFVLLSLIVAGCATTEDRDPRDPWEPMNRAVYKFNDVLDEAVAKPVATAYRKALHVEIRARIGNFFANLADPFIGVNNFLQGKPEEGFQDWVRFLFNSTIGLLGIHDVASDMGYEKHNEDFGQTFGRWGAGSGPYLMLPFFGPSSVRDGVGFALDSYLDPMQAIDPSDLRTGLYVTRLIDTRAGLLDAGNLMQEAALDRYIFLRDAYLQRRRSLVYDGRPPREPER